MSQENLEQRSDNKKIHETLKKNLFDYDGSVVGIFLIPYALFTFYASAACNEQQCSFTTIPDLSKYMRIESWITIRAFYVVSSFVVLNLVLYYLPIFGRLVKIENTNVSFATNLKYIPVIVIIISILSKKFLDVDILRIVHDDYYQIGMVSTMYGTILSIILFVKGKNVPKHKRNQDAIYGDYIHEFIVGREQSPIWFNSLHIKYFLLRYGHSGVIIVNFAWIYFDIIKRDSWSVNPAVCLFSLMQIINLYHYVLYEAEQLLTYEFRNEGTGYVIATGYFYYPFFTASISKYVLDQNIEFSNFTLICIAGMYAVGNYIYWTSNVIKHVFRLNRKDPRVAHMKYITTSCGNDLLVDSWWGVVRHPNYLGDIILHLTIATPVYDTPLIGIIIFTVWSLYDRIGRDGNRCKIKYGPDWERYCNKVPYHLIPGIF